MITMTDGQGTTYGIYDERETVVDWRRYRLSSRTNDATLTARVRKSFIPLVNDFDESDINNLPALEEAIRALGWFDNADYDKARQGMAIAVRYLDGEYARYEAETELGTAQLDASMGCSGVPNIL